MGPQHPSTHGVLRFVIKADGEVMRGRPLRRRLSCTARSRRSEKVGYVGFMPYTDRVGLRRCHAVHQGMGHGERGARRHRSPAARGVLPGDRDRAEPHREHLLAVGSMAMDIGAIHRSRTLSRTGVDQRSPPGALRVGLTFNYMRMGGCRLGPAYSLRGEGSRVLDHWSPIIDEYNALISFNKIYVERLAERGRDYLSGEAIDYNLVGRI